MFTAAFAADEESTSLSAYFTTRENKRLKGYVVKWFESPSFISCSQSCLRNPWCSSANFKGSSENEGKGTCELNKHDGSLINENTKFHEEEGTTFSMLLKVIHSKLYILAFKNLVFAFLLEKDNSCLLVVYYCGKGIGLRRTTKYMKKISEQQATIN